MTVEHIPSWTAEHLSESLNKFIELYGRCGFIICLILMDMDIEKGAEILGNIEVYITSPRENLGEVERTIITVKKRGIRIINSLP